jgi:hypothetical protein
MTSRWTVAAVAAGILLIVGIGVAVAGGSGTIARSPRSVAVANVTPRGWIPVDFGNAQLSVPPDWRIAYDDLCPAMVAPGVIYVGFAAVPRDVACALGDSPSDATIVEMWPVAVGGGGFHPTTINGIPVLKATQRQQVVVRAPSLGVEVNAYGPAADEVVDTATYSPAAVALAGGPTPSIQTDSRRLTVGAIQLSVPVHWRVDNTSLDGPGCGPAFALLQPNEVVVDSDTVDGAGLKCLRPVQPYHPFTPVDGVVVDLHPSTNPDWPPDDALVDCHVQEGLELCLYQRSSHPGQDQNAGIDILFVQVTVRSTRQRYLVELGLAGDGVSARMMLHSLRAA